MTSQHKDRVAALACGIPLEHRPITQENSAIANVNSTTIVSGGVAGYLATMKQHVAAVDADGTSVADGLIANEQRVTCFDASATLQQSPAI